MALSSEAVRILQQTGTLASKTTDAIGVIAAIPAADRIAAINSAQTLIKKLDDSHETRVEKQLEAIARERELHRASSAIRLLVNRLNRFHERLDETREVAVSMVSAGRALVLHVKCVEYENPHFLIFHGCDENGHAVELVQHLSQLNFAMVSVPRQEPASPKEPIGFKYTQTEPAAEE